MARFNRVLAVIVASAALVSAQNRANYPWWNSPVVDDPQLALTAAQKQKIHQIVRTYRPRLLDARNNAQKAEGELEDLLNDQDVDQQAAQSAIQKAADARASASRVFLEMSFQLRGVLTLDQWRLLVRRWDDVQKKRPTDTQVPPD